MPSLTTASEMSSTSSTRSSSSVDNQYSTSKIIRTSVAAGIIVLVLTALVLFFKVNPKETPPVIIVNVQISQWIRYRRRQGRQTTLATMLQSEQRANAYEIAAWSDEPGASFKPFSATLPQHNLPGGKKGKKARAQKRGGANAYAVHEWEGVAS